MVKRYFKSPVKSVCISRETLIMYNYLITKEFIDLKSSKNSVG